MTKLTAKGCGDETAHYRERRLRRYRKQGATCAVAVLVSKPGRTDPAAQAVTRSLLLRWRGDLATGVRAVPHHDPFGVN